MTPLWFHSYFIWLKKTTHTCCEKSIATPQQRSASPRQRDFPERKTHQKRPKRVARANGACKSNYCRRAKDKFTHSAQRLRWASLPIILTPPSSRLPSPQQLTWRYRSSKYRKIRKVCGRQAGAPLHIFHDRCISSALFTTEGATCGKCKTTDRELLPCFSLSLASEDKKKSYLYLTVNARNAT